MTFSELHDANLEWDKRTVISVWMGNNVVSMECGDALELFSEYEVESFGQFMAFLKGGDTE